MAWFRAGGGNGIPNQLKDNMDAVLNKKFGTSTTYPPGEWPDDVNLLGVLEEKTTTKSAIAHIEDGADRVPVKAWGVTLGASLDGYSSVDVVQTGKNLWNVNAITNTTNPNNATIVNNGNGTITVTTTTQQNVKTEQKLKDICPNVKVGETYFLKATTTGNQKIIYLHQAGISWTYGSAKVITSQMLESDVSLYASGTSSTATISDIQLEVGSTATTYAPYVEPTTHTVALGRTIYGGSVDVVNGTGTETYGLQTFDGTETWTLYETSFWYTSKPQTNVKSVHPCVTSNGVKITYTTTGQIRCYISENAGVVDTSTNMNTLLSNGVSFNYQLNENVDFTFTPINAETALGVNNFWADEGDSQVTYRSSGTETIVAPDLTTKSITENGTYNASSDNADGYSQVTVNVPTTPIISETDWNNLTDAQKRTYGLVIIQQANSGYKRGLYVNGADYPVLEEYSDVLTTGLSLDVLVNTTYTIECCFYALGYVNDGHVMGTTTGNHRNFHLTTYNNMWYFEGDVGKSDNQLYPVAGGMDITFRQEGDTAYMNGNSVGSIGLVDGGTSYALAQRGSAMTGNNYKYKYVKIWDANDNLIHDFRFMANKTMIDLVTLNTKTYT